MFLYALKSLSDRADSYHCSTGNTISICPGPWPENFDRDELPESQQILFDDFLACRAQSFIRDEENRQLMQVSRLSSSSAQCKKSMLGGMTEWIIHVSFVFLLCAAVYAIAARPTWSKRGTWCKIEEMMDSSVELGKLGPYVVSALELVKTVKSVLEQLSKIIEVARFIRRMCSVVQND
ncbi:hypothetical protein EDD18DRAFT_183102 [Armillaria luteobubalina]|uniref:Uncharacterized protein n=1 Tax=Armillaria luteobubalina TaxID=153913 RepID=A0AA39Q655_9AGAR|nr:hypothetical protein EDD18DRAFT_183102 [Armillaria luteobubalina]